MSLGNFIVPSQGIPEGEYTAQVDHIEFIENEKYGSYYIVNWRIIRPSEHEGIIHQERFNIENKDNSIRHMGIQNFGKFCMEIGGLAVGDPIKEENFLFKVANIFIRDKISDKDGRVYKNVIKRELVDEGAPKETAETILNSHAISGIAGSGMQPLQASTLNRIALNDIELL